MTTITNSLHATPAPTVNEQAGGLVLHVNLNSSDVDASALAEALQHFVSYYAPGAAAVAALTASPSPASIRGSLASAPTQQRALRPESPAPLAAPTAEAPTAALSATPARTTRFGRPTGQPVQPIGRTPQRQQGLRPRPQQLGARPVVSPDAPARRDHLLRTGFLRPDAPVQAPANEGLRIDDALRHVSIDGEAIEFTYKEFELLAYLARNARRIITRDELMETVWQDGTGDTGERTIDVHIRRVRNKLAQHRNVVTTVRGVGYRFDPTPQVRFREARAF